MRVYILKLKEEIIEDVINYVFEEEGFLDYSESILWTTKYNDVGECEIYTPYDDELWKLLQIDNYIYREDDDMFCRINSVQIKTDVENGNYIIATGTDMVSILADRIIDTSFKYSIRKDKPETSIASLIYKLIEDNIINSNDHYRNIANLIFKTENLTPIDADVDIDVSIGNLLETIKTLCKAYNYGFKIKCSLETNKLEFILYEGTNKSTVESDAYVEFSPAYGNIISSDYKEDNSIYKNACYVIYKDESTEEQRLLRVEETSEQGLKRREIIVDGSSISRELTKEEFENMFAGVLFDESKNIYYYIDSATGEQIPLGKKTGTGENEKIVITDIGYMELLKSLGKNTLAANTINIDFAGEVDVIDTYEYKVDYKLGDIVKVINDYGIEAEARIIEIIESDDIENGYVVEPKFEYINKKGGR